MQLLHLLLDLVLKLIFLMHFALQHNLLNQIMTVIPVDVQLTSIENTTDTHIVINAQSDKYEQLGYFTARLKVESILTNVISTAGQKDGSVVTVKIEGTFKPDGQ